MQMRIRDGLAEGVSALVKFTSSLLCTCVCGRMCMCVRVCVAATAAPTQRSRCGTTHLQARISVGALIEQQCHIDDGNGECHRLQDSFITLRQRDNSQAHHMLASSTRTSIVRSNRINDMQFVNGKHCTPVYLILLYFY